MTTRSEASRMVEDEISIAGVPPQDNKALPQEQSPLGDQDVADPPAMTDEEIRESFLSLSQA